MLIAMTTMVTMLLLLLTSLTSLTSLRSLTSLNKMTRYRSSLLSMSSSMSSLSSQAKELRSAIASSDERAALMMDALRGKGLNEDDRQGQGISMQIVEMDKGDGDSLPTTYDPILLSSYFEKRPSAVLTRIWQVLSTSGGYLRDILFDYITGNTKDIEVKRAAQLRNTIVSLGPFFIKVILLLLLLLLLLILPSLITLSLITLPLSLQAWSSIIYKA